MRIAMWMVVQQLLQMSTLWSPYMSFDDDNGYTAGPVEIRRQLLAEIETLQDKINEIFAKQFPNGFDKQRLHALQGRHDQVNEILGGSLRPMNLVQQCYRVHFRRNPQWSVGIRCMAILLLLFFLVMGIGVLVTAVSR